VLDGQMILELKYRQDLPPIFKRLVETFALAPQRASKYRLGIAALADVGFPLARPTDTMRDAASHV
jgi:hypothetical protein